jgi:competence protein ComEC
MHGMLNGLHMIFYLLAAITGMLHAAISPLPVVIASAVLFLRYFTIAVSSQVAYQSSVSIPSQAVVRLRVLIRCLIVFCVCFSIASLQLFHYLEHGVLEEAQEGLDLRVSGYPVSVETGVIEGKAKYKFDFILDDSGVNELSSRQRRTKLKLSLSPSYLGKSSFESMTAIKAGESYCFTVRLKAPRGLVNLAGFDYHLWLLEQGYFASGYVRAINQPCLRSSGHLDLAAETAQRIQIPWYVVLRLNAIAHLETFFDRYDVKHKGIYLALVTGDKSGLSEQETDLFRATGTAHLVVISGLHIGIVGGLVYGALLGGWTRFVAAQNGELALAFACLGSAAAIGIYACMAGFSVSTQRACLMAMVMLGARLLGTRWHVFTSVLVAMFILLLLDPLSALSTGFWLSFGAVLMLIVFLSFGKISLLHKSSANQAQGGNEFDGMRRCDADSKTPKNDKRMVPRVLSRLSEGAGIAFASQWSIFVGFTPLLLFLTGEFHPVSLLANLVAVPLFAFLVVPAVLLGAGLSAVWEELAYPVFALLDLIVAALKMGGSALAVFEAQLIPEGLFEWPLRSATTLGLAMLTILLWRFFRRPAGLLMCFLCLSLFTAQPDRLKHSEFAVNVFDVGQGLAVLLTTRSSRTLFDTGAAYDGFNVGQEIVLPLVKADMAGFDTGSDYDLDTLIVSHSDNDHAGGTQAVLKGLSVGWVISGEPDALYSRYLHGVPLMLPIADCKERSWRRDGVLFELFSLSDETFRSAARSFAKSNNRSCVLRVSNGQSSILLSGDIEQSVEHALIAKYGVLLASTVLIVPHHGSLTSSAPAFIDTVNPAIAVVSSGYKNRFSHPRHAVLERYRERGVTLFNTAEHGRLTFRFNGGTASHGDKASIPQIAYARDGVQRPWYLWFYR